MAKGDPARRARFMRRLMSLPLEIFSMILCDVHPRVLLMLSRTCRRFRNLLTSISRRFVWKRSIQSLFLPPCPDFHNEMAYVALLFEARCSFCHAVTHKILVVWFVRCCKRCVDEHFIDIHPSSPENDTICKLIGEPLHESPLRSIYPFPLFSLSELDSVSRQIPDLYFPPTQQHILDLECYIRVRRHQIFSLAMLSLELDTWKFDTRIATLEAEISTSRYRISTLEHQISTSDG